MKPSLIPIESIVVLNSIRLGDFSFQNENVELRCHTQTFVFFVCYSQSEVTRCSFNSSGSEFRIRFSDTNRSRKTQGERKEEKSNRRVL